MSQTWFINGRHMNINEVRAWREEQKKKHEVTSEVKLETVEEIKLEEVESGVITIEIPNTEEDLEELQKEFEKQEGRPVPNNKKNDKEWILSKLNTQ